MDSSTGIGVIGVNDAIELKSTIANGYFRVHKVTIDGDNLEGDWICTAQLLKIKADSKLDAKANGNGTNATSGNISQGDKVRVIRTFTENNKTKGYTYSGGTFVCWFQTYDVIQVKGDRAVIGIGTTVTAAVNVNDLEKV